MLGTRTAGEVADVFEHISAGDDRSLALLLIVHDLQPSGHTNRRRVVRPADPLAFLAKGRDAVDDQISGRDLVEQQIVAFARGTADRLSAAGAEPEWRMRLLDRARLDHDVVEPPALVVIREPLLCRSRLSDQLLCRVVPLLRPLLFDAETRHRIAPLPLAD